MVKSKLALVLDSLFISSLSSTLLYLWLRHEIKNANLLHFFLILMNICLFILILYLFFKSNNKNLTRGANENFLKKCLEFLLLCDYQTYSLFFCKLFSCSQISNYFYKFQDKFLYINLKTPLSSADYFDAQELYFKNKKQDEKLIFISNNSNKDFEELSSISKLNYSYLSSDILLKIMIQKNIYPIEKQSKATQNYKQKFKQIIKSKTQGITKSHFKEIFFTSISLLFLSIVVPFSKYYLIAGSVLLIISIISLFNKNMQEKQDENDLLNDK